MIPQLLLEEILLGEKAENFAEKWALQLWLMAQRLLLAQKVPGSFGDCCGHLQC